MIEQVRYYDEENGAALFYAAIRYGSRQVSLAAAILTSKDEPATGLRSVCNSLLIC